MLVLQVLDGDIWYGLSRSHDAAALALLRDRWASVHGFGTARFRIVTLDAAEVDAERWLGTVEIEDAPEPALA
jgi:hypothetical protein